MCRQIVIAFPKLVALYGEDTLACRSVPTATQRRSEQCNVVFKGGRHHGDYGHRHVGSGQFSRDVETQYSKSKYNPMPPNPFRLRRWCVNRSTAESR